MLQAAVSPEAGGAFQSCQAGVVEVEWCVKAVTV